MGGCEILTELWAAKPWKTLAFDHFVGNDRGRAAKR